MPLVENFAEDLSLRRPVRRWLMSNDELESSSCADEEARSNLAARNALVTSCGAPGSGVRGLTGEPLFGWYSDGVDSCRQFQEASEDERRMGLFNEDRCDFCVRGARRRSARGSTLEGGMETVLRLGRN